jgi:hypothetical protein
MEEIIIQVEEPEPKKADPKPVEKKVEPTPTPKVEAAKPAAPTPTAAQVAKKKLR